jgi:AcrR family transcriptional regulator
MATNRDKTTPYQRLVAAIVPLVATHDYEHVSVSRLIARAGISRATFYMHFTSREACFLAALTELERHVLAAVTCAIDDRPRQDPAVAAIAALCAFAQKHPAQARVLINAPMAAGPRALAARDHAVDEIAHLVGHARRDAAVDLPTRALPTETLIGTTYRLLGSRLRRGERTHEPAREQLLEWMAAYDDSTAERRWRTLASAKAPVRPPLSTRAPLRPPPVPAPGRPRQTTAEMAENHRLRIIFATAQVIQRDGYPAASVAAITRAASLDSRSFYSLFAGRRDAFWALRELGFQHAMAVTAGAFFSAESWPRRIWAAALAFTEFLRQNPTLTHACLTESDAGGPETAQRFEELVAGCTIFLLEGYRYRPGDHGTSPSPATLDAIAMAELEIIYRHVRTSSSSDMARLTGRIAYTCLAPFVGAVRAGELIDELQSS